MQMPRASVSAAAATLAALLTISVGVSHAATPDLVDGATSAVLGLPLSAAAVLAMLLLLLLALLVLVYAQPAWVMDLVVRHSHTSVLWCVRTSAHVCALTIDDAPSPATPQILDLLRDHGVTATFFIISNNIKGNEEVVRRIVREGHRLGNHLTEDRASILDELHVFEQKLQECDAAIARFQPHHDSDNKSHAESSTPTTAWETESDDYDTKSADATERTRLLDTSTSSVPSVSSTPPPANSKWLRPASGWFTSNMREIVMSHGYKICMGSVYPHDAQIKSERLNALYLRRRTRPGAVLIVHDRSWTVGVLREALPALVRKFRFVSLDELSLHQHAHKVKSAAT
jgi:peptidoglycan/xylan/chitin deacetylase (PgdA/CDA1 family)